MYRMSIAIQRFASEIGVDYATAVGIAVLLKEMEPEFETMNDDIFWMNIGKKIPVERDTLVDKYRDMVGDIKRDKERDKKRAQRARKRDHIAEMRVNTAENTDCPLECPPNCPPECPPNGKNDGYIDNIYQVSNTDSEKDNDLKESISSSPSSETPSPKPSLTGTARAPRRRPRTVKPEQFDSFWDVYPRKVNKRDAQKAWASLNPTDELVERIVEDVKQRIKIDWASREKRYIPHPATYINGARWEDEHTTETGVKSSFQLGQRRDAQPMYFTNDDDD